DHTARPDGTVFVFMQRGGQMPPIHQIAADRVAPPLAARFFGLPLIKQVPLPAPENQPVRVVHPIARGREVKLRSHILIYEVCIGAWRKTGAANCGSSSPSLLAMMKVAKPLPMRLVIARASLIKRSMPIRMARPATSEVLCVL